MAGAGVQGDGHIPQPLRFQTLVHFGHAPAAVAHRVLIAGIQPYRQVFGNGGEPFRAVTAVHQLHQLAKAAVGKDKAAPGVFHVAPANLFIVADPVHRRVMLGGLIVIAGRQLVQQLGSALAALQKGDQGDQELARAHGGIFAGGAAEQQRLQVAAVAGRVQPGDKGTHAVPQQEVGQAGIPFTDGAALELLILHQVVPRPLFAEIAQRFAVDFGGGAVPQVIDAADDVAGIGQVLRQRLVPHNVFTHPVAELHDGTPLSLRFKQKAGKRAFPVAGMQGKGASFHAFGPPRFLSRGVIPGRGPPP